MATLPWTSQDLEMLPDNGKHYEIIEGELYVSTWPHFLILPNNAQNYFLLDTSQTRLQFGQTTIYALGEGYCR